jgi:hypothetical protein
MRCRSALAIAVAVSILGATSGVLRGADVASGPVIFSNSEVLSFALQAPFAELFTRAQQDPDASVTGIVTIENVTIDGVVISTRGHSSRQPTECAFPKLKMRFTRVPESSPFVGLTTLKIGTHCGDTPGNTLTPKYGRLANEKAPPREAFVYRLLEAVDVPTLKARAARITYVSPGGEPIVRNAMLLEDDDDAMKRLGATDVLDPEFFEHAQATFGRLDAAKVVFAEALVGNFDWHLKISASDTYRASPHRLWNMLALKRADGTSIPLITDFDIAGIVTGNHEWFPMVFDENFVSSRSRPQVEVIAQLQMARSRFSRSELDAVRNHFIQRKAAAFQALAESNLDSDGMQNARGYLTAFFAAIEMEDGFYMPVVAKPGVKAYLDPGATRAACPNAAVIPVGTPVSATSDRQKNLIRVRLLDALWYWTGSFQCDAIHHETVWIDAAAIGTKD